MQTVTRVYIIYIEKGISRRFMWFLHRYIERDIYMERRCTSQIHRQINRHTHVTRRLTNTGYYKQESKKNSIVIISNGTSQQPKMSCVHSSEFFPVPIARNSTKRNTSFRNSQGLPSAILRQSQRATSQIRNCHHDVVYNPAPQNTTHRVSIT